MKHSFRGHPPYHTKTIQYKLILCTLIITDLTTLTTIMDIKDTVIMSTRGGHVQTTEVNEIVD